MLKQLKLSNFRIFDDEVTVRFRPITILIGKNNAGKSSIIKFLLMLQQSLDLGAPEFLSSEGHAVQLGLFEYLKNSNTAKKYLKFRLDMSEPMSPQFSIMNYIRKFSEEYESDIDFTKLSYSSEATVSYARKQQFGKDTRTAISMISEDPHQVIFERSKKVFAGVNFLDFTINALTELQKIPKESDPKETPEILAKAMIKFAAETDCIGIIRNQIQSLKHLLPVRNETKRVVIDAPPPPGNVGQHGEFALPHLKKILDEKSSEKEHGLGYLLDVRRPEKKLVLKYLEAIASVEGIRFDNLSYMIECLATNKETGAETHIGNFGFGVSQCIPIFVQGAIMPRYTSLMVEQPEAQLHPTAQLELGSFFADLWRERSVGSIIETHSSNILLRLRKLVAEKKTKADDISVVFFDIEDGKAIIKNLDINQDGTMEDGLPMEFFGADIIEGLELGAAKFKQSEEDHEQLDQ